jgi:hypothetical protein
VKKLFRNVLWLPVLLVTTVSAAAPVLHDVQLSAEHRYLLRGEGFGSACSGCEVLVTYTDGFRYSVPVEEWSDRAIRVQVPDLNRDVTLRVAVKAGKAISNALPVQLRPRVLSPAQLKSAAPGVAALFERSSEIKVGNRGEELYTVSVSGPGCGQRAWVFDHARIRHIRQRFGEAQIVSQPQEPCVQCEPVQVRWYHEPTGYLHFQLEVYRREIDGACPARVR